MFQKNQGCLRFFQKSEVVFHLHFFLGRLQFARELRSFSRKTFPSPVNLLGQHSMINLGK